MKSPAARLVGCVSGLLLAACGSAAAQGSGGSSQPILANGYTACQTDTLTSQAAVNAAVNDNGGSLPSWLKSSPSGMDMVASGDFAAIVANGYLHDPPRGCRNFALTTKTQNGSLVYLVTGQP